MNRLLLLAAAMTLASVAYAAPPVESFVEAAGPNGPLKGTMLLPAGARMPPIVLIVPGSGPTDRDGDNPLGVKARPLRLLAEGLAAEGVGSVRVDKRGMFASRAAVPDANRVTIGDYADDVAAWATAITRQTKAKCIWVAGHSEGGLVALAAAHRDGICGLVLISAAGRPIGTVLREQLKANPANAPFLPQALGAIDAMEAGRSVDSTRLDPALQRLFAPAVQPYFIDLMRYDPTALIAKAGKPVLIVQGDRDLQIKPADAQALKAADPAATLVMVPGMNHMLKHVDSDDRAANMTTYADPSLPLAPGLVDAVAGFVKRGGR